MKLTDEQHAVLDAFARTRKNIIVRARAGAAKTTTLRLLVDAHKSRSIYLAFNKAIVMEARKTMNARCQVMTLNGIGHQTLAKGISHKIRLDTRKMFKILQEARYRGKDFAEVLRALRLSKHHGFVPVNTQSLINEEEFFNRLDMKFSPETRVTIREALNSSYFMALQDGIIDFDDQILIPTLTRMTFPTAPVIFIDEAQDLSAINQQMLKMIVGMGSRLVAVGDDAQAIYGFRGADENSMNNLQDRFRMSPYGLTMTFRCSQEVTRHANWRTGDMRHAPDAPMGAVQHHTYINMKDITPGTAILCRNNAPLLRLTLRMLHAGMVPNYLGRDVLDELIRTLEKITNKGDTKAQALDSIDLWEEEKKRTWKSGNIVEDKAECMRLFFRDSSNAGEAIARIRALQASNGDDVVLSTIHKSKGAEYDHVIIIDRHLIARGTVQEDNLLYVAQTRARDTLQYCHETNIGDRKATATAKEFG